MKNFVGIDVGGTNIKAVLLDEKKKQTRSVTLPTQANSGKKAIAKNILRAATIVAAGKKVSAIGIALAGAVNAEKGMLVDAPNLREFEKFPIKRILQKRFRVPTVVENDANAAAFAESQIGCGKKSKILVLLTLGTGMGCGIIIGGKLFTGATHSAAEFGHTIIDSRGYKCKCGNFGCLEAMANARFLERKAKELIAKGKKSPLKRFDALSIQLAAEKGDAVAKLAYKEFAENLGIGLANICNIFNPDLIVLSGGIARAKTIFPVATKKMKQLAFRQNAEHVKVCSAKAGYFAGATGAALLAMQKK